MDSKTWRGPSGVPALLLRVLVSCLLGGFALFMARDEAGGNRIALVLLALLLAVLAVWAIVDHVRNAPRG